MTGANAHEDYALTVERPYLDRLSLWPRFAFGDEDIDGLVPSCKVESWRDLERVVGIPPHSSNVGQMIYRGHRRYDWPLAPGLSRAFDGGAIPGEWASGILHKFKLSMRGRGSDISSYDDNEVWAIGQHFGLATPLLDWTESAFVALFFAFADSNRVEEKDNPTRTVFCLNRSALDDVLEDFFFEPRFGENTRLVNQAGLFTVTSSEAENPVTEIINALGDAGAIDLDNPDAEQLAKFVCKIHIPNVDRVACLSMLRKMNIHHASLFPDPTGASSYCNDWLSRAVAERKELEKALAVARATTAVAETKPIEMPSDEAGADAVLEDVLGQLASLEGSGLFDRRTIARRVHDLYASRSGIDWWAPRTELAAAAGLAIDNGIAVDAELRTSDAAILAAGDCCSFPHPLFGGRRLRFESWQNAQELGQLAAVNLAGARQAVAHVPWMWSDQYELGLQIVGLPAAGVATVVRRDGASRVLLFHLGADGRLLGASGLGPGSAVARDIKLAQRLIARRAAPDPAYLADPAASLKALLPPLPVAAG